MTPLKRLLKQAGISQAGLARQLGLSPAAVAQMVNHDQWPKSRDRAELAAAIEAVLTAKGLTEEMIRQALRKAKPKSQLKTEEPMLLENVRLSQKAKRHFNLFRDPLAEDLNGPEEVFATADIRYVREAMWQTARSGGFLAVVGESGAGKSTVRRDLIERIRREQAPVIVIEPYVLGLEENEKRGHTLKAGGIADAIVCALDPRATPRRTMEAKSRQVHRLLSDSRRAGFHHCLIIEEAHCLPTPTLKHLKRFYELEDGFARLLSVILIGQPELGLRLSRYDWQVREVVQRCEVVYLAPLDNELEAYLKFRFDKAGANLAKVLAPGAVEAVAESLTQRRRGGGLQSFIYPLAVNNLVKAAMNLAADLGAPQVDAGIVREAAQPLTNHDMRKAS